jgi:hypothetical protein
VGKQKKRASDQTPDTPLNSWVGLRGFELPNRTGARVILQERGLELADGGAAIGQQFAAADDASVRATLSAVAESLRALAGAFAPPDSSLAQ